jgi:hypothetical protein
VNRSRPTKLSLQGQQSENDSTSKLQAGDLFDLLNCQADTFDLPDTQQDRVNQVNPLRFPAIADLPRSTSHARRIQNPASSLTAAWYLFQLRGPEVADIPEPSNDPGPFELGSPPMAPTPSAKPSIGLKSSYLPRSPTENPSAWSSMPSSPTADWAKVLRNKFLISHRSLRRSACFSGDNSVNDRARLDLKRVRFDFDNEELIESKGVSDQGNSMCFSLDCYHPPDEKQLPTQGKHRGEPIDIQHVISEIDRYTS